MPVEELGTFSIRRLQILDDEGRADSKLDPGLDKESLKKLYRAMLLSRAVDEKGLKLQRQGRIGTFGPAIGQEAVSCAAALALAEEDWFVPSFRELGGMLMRGWPVENFVQFHRGFEEGNRFPDGSRTLPISIIVAGHLPHAVGLAYAMRRKGEKSAVVTFTGDGGTSEGDFHEALNFAGVWRAPVVFVVQNNQWAISLPRSGQTASKTLAQKAVAYGIEGIQVDGNDSLAVYAAVSEGLARAREGGGPTLVEAVTYRLVMHTTSDDPTRYRTSDEEQTWWKKEPIGRLGRYLQRKRVLSQKQLDSLAEEVKQEVEEAVNRLESEPLPPPETCFEHALGTPHPNLDEQKEELLRALKEGDQ